MQLRSHKPTNARNKCFNKCTVTKYSSTKTMTMQKHNDNTKTLHFRRTPRKTKVWTNSFEQTTSTNMHNRFINSCLLFLLWINDNVAMLF